MPVRMVTVQVGAKTLALRVKAADTPERQAGGLSVRDARRRSSRNLILFDFGDEILTQFHMKNVPAALDIAFVKADGRIFSILRMDPSPTAALRAHGPFRLRPRGPRGLLREPGHPPGRSAAGALRRSLTRPRARSATRRAPATSSRLWVVLALTASFLLVEVGGGAGDGQPRRSSPTPPTCSSTRAASLMSLLAVWFAERPATPAKTYGYYRVEILAALVNGVVLCLLAVGILVKAYERLWRPPRRAGAPDPRRGGRSGSRVNLRRRGAPAIAARARA